MNMRFIKLAEVKSRTGKSRASIYRGIKNGTFPAQVKTGERSSAWIESEVQAWLDSCVTQRDTMAGKK